jgi:hypothetical protein
VRFYLHRLTWLKQAFLSTLFFPPFFWGEGGFQRLRVAGAEVFARAFVHVRLYVRVYVFAGCPFWGSIVIINPLIIRPFFDSFVLPVVGLSQMHQHSR